MTIRPVLYILPLTFTAVAALAEGPVKCPVIAKETMAEIQKTKKYVTDGDNKNVWTFHKQGGRDLNIATSIENLTVEAQNGECSYQAIFNPEEFEVGSDGMRDTGTFEPEWFERFTLKLESTNASAKN